MKKIIIAIDGHSSCGKSTLARDLAKKLGYAYIDTGAMYRAVTLYFLDNGIDREDLLAVQKALDGIQIQFQYSEAGNQTLLNGKVVESEIREMRVSQEVSPVSAISAVRRAMVAQQQEMGKQGGVVLEGRDIGTVVFPDADLKIFLTASIEERVRRRFTEMKAKGIPVAEDQVRENLLERDRIDSSREDSPLKQAKDARILDNTQLNREEQLELAFEWAREVQEK